MRSEWRVRQETEMLSGIVYQVYRLKDKTKEDRRDNREVLRNCPSKVHAESVARDRNKYEAEHFWEHKHE